MRTLSVLIGHSEEKVKETQISTQQFTKKSRAADTMIPEDSQVG